QAEDGIRDRTVTGVQTCALPIFHGVVSDRPPAGESDVDRGQRAEADDALAIAIETARPVGDVRVERGRALVGILRAHQVREPARSEERRVGKECRAWEGAACENT